MSEPILSPEAKALFIAFAEDSFNWNGESLVNGNVVVDEAGKGYLTDLKKKGLLTTFRDEGLSWVCFTDEGKRYSCEVLGIELA